MTATSAAARPFLGAPVDIASLAVFRVLFGALMLASAVRFWARGWIEEIYVQPAFHFHYYGFSWVRPWPGWGMYAHFAIMAIAALLVALGLWYRLAAIVFFITFSYVELCEKATYLNHYYFISVVSLLMIFMPLHGAASLDASRDPGVRSRAAPAWALWALRLQIGLVYLFAGLAKLNGDWLLRAQPLGIWLAARRDLPLLGPLLADPWVAYAMSYAGAAFDLSAFFLLLWPRARPFAYTAVVAFHALTGLLFPIGMFPWIMIAAALVFFPPGWPRRALGPLLRRWPSLLGPPPDPGAASPAQRLGRLGLAALGAHFIIQIALPLRHFLYPGDAGWTDEGFRFAWRVMLVEKTGMVEYRVRDPATGRVWGVDPAARLTPLQTKMMGQSPDMILEYAHHLAGEFAARGIRDVEVFADAYAAINGRPSQRLVDPGVDLARERDSLRPARWILPREHAAPR
jgi:hypothetical protein